MKKNKDKKFSNYEIAVVISIIIIIIFCIVAVSFGLLSFDDLPTNYIGAALSSLIGALIVLVLLRGQTDVVEKKGKDIKILEKKTEVFKDYIQDAWEVWEEQKIDLLQFQNLISKYYKNLMIYLKKERLEKVGNNLSGMGRLIGKSKQEDIKELRSNIIGIINELSQELELGGQVDTTIMDEHDKILFPLVFKNEILNELNKALPTDKDLEKGKEEIYMRGKYPNVSISFEFRKYKGCKILITGFDGKHMDFCLHVDRNIHQFDPFRHDYDGFEETIGGDFYINHITKPIDDKKIDKEVYVELDNKLAPKLNFSAPESLEKYRIEHRDFAKTLANRVGYYYRELRLNEEYSIIDFLEKYIDKK